MATQLDLNNLVPEAAEVTIGNDTLKVLPPTLRALFVINKMAQKVTSVEGDPIEIDNIKVELKAELVKLIPGLENHELNDSQLLALCGLVAEMAAPEKEETDEAKTGGRVTPDPKATEA